MSESAEAAELQRLKARMAELEAELKKAKGDLRTVSYTHLTLPTICSV